MKRKRVISIIVLLVLLFTSFDLTVFASTNSLENEKKAYLVKFADNTKLDNQLEGKKLKKKYKHTSLALVDLSETELLELIQSKTVEFIEEDTLIQLAEATGPVGVETPGDSPQSETIDPTGPVESGETVHDELSQPIVREETASTADGAGIKIAILDTGITASESVYVAGGASFVESTEDYLDDNGHGTYLASLIAGSKSELNSTAVGVELYSLKVLNDQAQGTYGQVIEALEWAVDNKMDIVNMSFGADIYSNAFAEAVKYAYDNGVLLIAAVGNDSDSQIDYPARFNSVIAVGAVDQSHIRAPFSNVGTELELMALGVDVAGLGLDGETVIKSGTSPAVAQVSGIAALYLQAFQGISNMEVRDLLNASASHIGDVSEYGNGLAQFTTLDTQTDDTILNEEAENEWIKQEIIKQEEKAEKRQETKTQREEKKIEEITAKANIANKAAKNEEDEEGRKKGTIIEVSEERERPDASQRELSERILRQLNREDEKRKRQEEEVTVTRNKEVLAVEWGIAAAEIQAQLDKGYTLEEVETAIRQRKQQKKGASLSDVLEVNKLKQVNQSSQAKSEIKSDIGNLDLQIANVFSTSSIPVDPEAPKLDMLKLKTGEAPFQVSLENESISTVSGSLAVSESDFTLPGRSGSGFSLSRTYNSGSSQFYDMDVNSSTNTSYKYYVEINGSATLWRTTYYLSYYQRQIANKYKCSNNDFVTTVSDTKIGETGPLSYSTQAARDAAYYSLSANPQVTDKSDCAAYDRYRVTTYHLSRESTSSTGMDGTSSYTRYLGPYSTESEANSVRQSIIVGNSDYATSPSGNPNDIQYAITRTIQGTSIVSEPSYSYSYMNRLVDAKEEMLFPIGKGWSWNIPYVTFEGGTYVHLAGNGTYKVENQSLKDYPYKDVQFVTDSTVTVNGIQSAYMLKLRAGERQYFSADGMLIQLSDGYNNHTQFKYSTVSPYGKVLTSISDAIGNQITIAYTTSQVTLKMGDREVVYKKELKNNKELLSQVIDPMMRVTTYDYYIANASFNLLGSTPITSNPYALLTGVTHPTGAKTIYEYEGSPVKRYTSSNSVNEAYRIAVRKDEITYAGNVKEVFNRASLIYPQDMGSSYNQDMTFTTELLRGSVKSIYTYKKDYLNDAVAPMFYNTKIEATDLTTRRFTEQSYDEVNHNPYPISTTTYMASGLIESTRVTSSVQYDTWGNVIRETDPLGNQTTYGFDDTSHLMTSTLVPAGGGKSLYVQLLRNVQGDVTDYSIRENNASGTLLRRSTNTYDAFGNLIRQEQHGADLIAEAEITYDGLSAFPIKASYSYTDANGVVQTFQPEATYDTVTGATKSIKDGNGNITSYVMDKLNRIIEVTNPGQTTISVQYQDSTNQITTTNEANKKSLITFNALGLQTEAGIYENGVYVSKSKSGYDTLSRNSWSEDSSGNQTILSYDNWNRIVKTTNADGSFSTASFEDLNYKSIVTDEEGNADISQYDAYGRLLYSQAKQSGAFYTVQSYSYDEVGKVKSVQDALNKITNHFYDVLGQLTSVKNAKQETTAYKYDLFGNLTATVYPDGSKLLKQYDELGRLKTQTDSMGKIKKIFYDANGNMNRFEDRKGVAFTYVYDTRNRMISRTSPNESISYTYTSDGQRKTMTDQTGTTTYTYDNNTGQLTTQKYPDNKTISHTYDGHGNMLTTSGPFSRITTYGYDNVNRLKTVSTDSNLNATYSYLKNDLISKIEVANGISSELTYDGLQMTKLQHKKTSGMVLNTYDYIYSLMGNIMKRSESGASTTFSYDELGRVKTNSQFTESYEYDSKGNRQALSSDALPEITEAAYEYDDWNRLTKVTTFEGVITYKYNGDDRLVERTENGETIRYYWSNDRIVAEGKVQGGVVSEKASYVYGIGLLERINGADGSRSSYLFNGHGDVAEMRDMQGNVQNQYTYDIWGKPLKVTESVDNPFRYSGEYWDDSVNLQYLRARWYDPSTARFINEDTYEGDITNPLTLNLYTYVGNNPQKYVDPSGHCFWDACIFEGIAVIALVEGAIFVVGATSILIWNAETAPKEVPRIDKPKLTVIQGGKNNNNQSKPMAPPLPVPQSVEKNKQDKVILYHYTSKEGYDGILASNKIYASKKAIRANDARFGDGVYLTDIAPNTASNKKLSQALFNNPNQTKRIQYYIAIDITDLAIKYGRENVFVYLTENYLDISKRVVSSGVNNGNGQII